MAHRSCIPWTSLPPTWRWKRRWANTFANRIMRPGKVMNSADDNRTCFTGLPRNVSKTIFYIGDEHASR